ncbi:MAG: hypothetical protein M3032_02645 [Verrucomicrobiota bacterium]|nr:hypothetical protein [Verrucomicrobiota bacterium]
MITMKPKTSRSLLAVLVVALLSIVAVLPASAQVTAYSNITTFSGFGLTNGGAASNGSFFATTMVADDLNLIAGAAGQSVTGFRFSVANFNSTAVSARPTINFYAINGAGGGPGTLLASLTFNAISFTAGSVATFTFNQANLFTIPANGSIWAGIFFDNSGTTATATQLNNLGQGIYNPPTVGSSADLFFQGTTAGPSGSNPAGTFSNFGGNPQANFGWQVNVAALTPAAVPDTGSTMLMLMLGGGGLVLLQRRMQRSLN